MAEIIQVYRYDDEVYEIGKPIPPREILLEFLTSSEKVVEEAIRAACPKAAEIRKTCIFTWEDKCKAKLYWKYSKRSSSTSLMSRKATYYTGVT